MTIKQSFAVIKELPGKPVALKIKMHFPVALYIPTQSLPFSGQNLLVNEHRCWKYSATPSGLISDQKESHSSNELMEWYFLSNWETKVVLCYIFFTLECSFLLWLGWGIPRRPRSSWTQLPWPRASISGILHHPTGCTCHSDSAHFHITMRNTPHSGKCSFLCGFRPGANYALLFLANLEGLIFLFPFLLLDNFYTT